MISTQQAAWQGARRFGKRGIFSSICEDERELRNAAWQPQTPFFKRLLDIFDNRVDFLAFFRC
jgi:hypothetical protein